MPDVTWRRSSFCSQDSCVEVADLPDGMVAIRHSDECPNCGGETTTDGCGYGLRQCQTCGYWTHEPHRVIVTRAEWDAFTAGVRAGEFDPPEATQ